MVPPAHAINSKAFRDSKMEIDLGVFWRVDRIDNINNTSQSFDAAFTVYLSWKPEVTEWEVIRTKTAYDLMNFNVSKTKLFYSSFS